MTSMERTLTALGHKEPDRVPLFLLFSHYGAKHLGLTTKEYFASPENIIKAQIELQREFKSDCFYTFCYAALETEAMGGIVYFPEETPPNSASPIFHEDQDIKDFKIPKISTSEPLSRVLEVTKALSDESKGNVPIIGVVMSPFSLPVMQLGFDKYIEMLYLKPDLFKELMQKNQEFCINWANSQLEAGATAICYFNPLSSREMTEKDLYHRTGFPVDLETTKKINGPIATHLASSLALPSIDEVLQTGSAVLGISQRDDLALLKSKSRNKITLLGNLSGINLVHANEEEIDKSIKTLIQEAGEGGGLIISDNHGEIPWQVPKTALHQIVKSIEKWGTYPLIPG
ncbi:MAG: uroporphyrinogen decarboxylase family protein [Spirochaetales bacterium]|nr:uroporphyrinogen decarboxylase family protein [Spirochaetales bacterium]